MPYGSVADLPKHIKKYSPKLQRQYLNVWNSVYNRILKQGGNVKDAEQRAFRGAASVLKKRFKKGQNRGNESHSDYFTMLVDSFLGNLKG